MGQIGLLFSFAVVVGLVWFLWYTFHGKPPDRTPYVAWADQTDFTELVGRDATGAIRWRHRLPAAAESFTRILDRGGEDYSAPGEGIVHRLVDMVRRGSPREGVIYFLAFENPQLEDRIMSLDPVTGLRWEKTVREVIGPMAKRFPTGWVERRHEQFSIAGVRKTVILFGHNREWPSVIVVLDDSGAVLGRFAHAGPLTGMHLDHLTPATWARFLVIAEGASAARGAGVVVVLDALNIAGSSPEQAGSPFHCSECGPPGPGVRYYEFPRTEVEVAGNLPLVNPYGGSFDDYGTGTYYRSFSAGYGVTYFFSEDFDRVRVKVEDDYWRRHQELESAGRITHARDVCPESKGPRAIRTWSAALGWRDVTLEPWTWSR